MSLALSGKEESAIGLLKRAVEQDGKGKSQEALVCYKEGIKLLMDVMKGMESNTSTYQKYTGIVFCWYFF